MNRKQFFLLLVLVVVVGGAGLAVHFHRSASWEGTGASGARVLDKFDLNSVEQIVILNNGGTVTLAKKDDAWAVRERDDYPADFSRVRNFIQNLWQLKPVQDVKVGPSKLALLDLDAPEKRDDHSATLVELRDKDSRAVAALRVGKMFMKKSADFPGEETPAGRYVMPANGKGSVSLVSEPLEEADFQPGSWLDKAFPKIERLESVTISRGSSSLKFFREDDSSKDWKLDGLKSDELLDAAKIPPFVSMFSTVNFTDVEPANASREGLDTTVVVKTFDGVTFTLRFGNAQDDMVPMTISAAAAPFPKERSPGKDEKPEDKKRLDDEFAAKTKRLEENLAKAKACEAWVYLVSKATYGPLWKSREDFMKKEEPSPKPSMPKVPVTVMPGFANDPAQEVR